MLHLFCYLAKFECRSHRKFHFKGKVKLHETKLEFVLDVNHRQMFL